MFKLKPTNWILLIVGLYYTVFPHSMHVRYGLDFGLPHMAHIAFGIALLLFVTWRETKQLNPLVLIKRVLK